MTFLIEKNPNYTVADGKLMQRALEIAAKKLDIACKDHPERKTLTRFVRAAFIIGNRDAEAIANFAVEAVLTRRKNTLKG
ncbi:MAG: hypothetical protein ACREIP_07930 [Alphaproteobacteria bacterium]